MRYLKFIDLPSTVLTKEEEDHLDSELAFEAWCIKNRNGYGRKIGQYEALSAFKEDMYDLCMDHISFNDNRKHWSELLNKVRNEKNLDVQRAKAYPIEEIVRKYGYEIRQGFIQSPFLPEQRTGSCKIYANTNSWHDFGSGQGGDVIDFVRKVGGMNFVEAVNLLT